MTALTQSSMATPLHVLLVTARYLPYVGGTEMHNYEVAKRLAAQGVRVTVLTTNPGGKLPSHEEQDGVTIRRVRAWPADRDYYFAPGLYRAIARGEWDVVHLQGYHTLVAPLTMAAAARAGIPLVVTFHSGGHSSQLRNTARSLQIAALRPFFKHAERLIAVSNFEAGFFKEQLSLPAAKFTVVPNGSNLPRLNGNRPDRIPGLIVAVGRLEAYKGHQKLIGALPLLLQHQPDARLRIAGRGPYEADLRRLAAQMGVQGRVEIGAIPASDREGMARLMSSASVVALLSEYESQGLGVTEALSLGCRVMVADNSALSELAAHDQVSTVPSDATPEVIAAELLNAMRQATNSEATVTLPTWDDCAHDLLAIYHSVTNGRGSKHQQSIRPAETAAHQTLAISPIAGKE